MWISNKKQKAKITALNNTLRRIQFQMFSKGCDSYVKPDIESKLSKAVMIIKCRNHVILNIKSTDILH